MTELSEMTAEEVQDAIRDEEQTCRRKLSNAQHAHQNNVNAIMFTHRQRMDELRAALIHAGYKEAQDVQEP